MESFNTCVYYTLEKWASKCFLNYEGFFFSSTEREFKIFPKNRFNLEHASDKWLTPVACIFVMQLCHKGIMILMADFINNFALLRCISLENRSCICDQQFSNNSKSKISTPKQDTLQFLIHLIDNMSATINFKQARLPLQPSPLSFFSIKFRKDCGQTCKSYLSGDFVRNSVKLEIRLFVKNFWEPW